MAMKQAAALPDLDDARTGVSWESAPSGNQFLASLSVATQHRLFPHLNEVFLPLGKVLKRPGCELKKVYFPVDCILSMRQLTENGASTGVSLVGKEGLLGAAVCMGGENGQSRAMVQSAGYAFALSPQRLKEEFDYHNDLRMAVLRYTQALMTQIGQNAVCNRHHSIDQQLCRWLLLLRDRLPSNCLVMTQDLIASLIGVRRESVTGAAGKLKKLGAIECNRGNLTVVDRIQLEMLACECYEVVRKETGRLLGLQGPSPLLSRVS